MLSQSHIGFILVVYLMIVIVIFKVGLATGGAQESFMSLPFNEYRKKFMCMYRSDEPGCENIEFRRPHRKHVGVLISTSGKKLGVYSQKDYSNVGRMRLLVHHPCVSWSQRLFSWMPGVTCDETWEIWKDLVSILPSHGDTFTLRGETYSFNSLEDDAFELKVKMGTLFGDDVIPLYRARKSKNYYGKSGYLHYKLKISSKVDIFDGDKVVVDGKEYVFQDKRSLGI